MSNIRELAVTDLANELADNSLSLDQVTIWDVRDYNDYLEGHLEGAVNQPVNQGYNEAMLDSVDGQIYVLCGGGSKALRAAKLINELNDTLDVVILTGGTRQAKAEGLTIVTGDSVFAT